MDNKRFIKQTFLSEDKLISTKTKNKILDILSLRITELLANPKSIKYKSKIIALDLLIKDAYVISIYKVQFNQFSDMLDKEIEKIEKKVK